MTLPPPDKNPNLCKKCGKNRINRYFNKCRCVDESNKPRRDKVFKPKA